MRKFLLATVFSVSLVSVAMANPIQTFNGNGPNNQTQVYGNGSASQGQQSFTKSNATGGNVGNVNGSNRLSNTVNLNGVGGSNSNGYNYGNLPVSSAIAPSFGGGMNGCSGSAASLGGQFQLFGLSAGGTNMDNVCEAMRLGEMDVAREVECTDSREFRNAAYRLGRPCMVDREKYAKERAAMVPVVPVVTQPETPVEPVKTGWDHHCKKHDSLGYCKRN